MIKDDSFLKDSQDIITNTFFNKNFNNNLFNDLMCGNKRLNYLFLSTYLDCLKETLKVEIPKLSYQQFIEEFIPAYQESVKQLPSSYILFSLMSFQQHYAYHFPELRDEKHYQEVVSSLIKCDSALPLEYKLAISVHFPQYYKIKKNNGLKL